MRTPIDTTLVATLRDLRGEHDPVMVTMPSPRSMRRMDWQALWLRNLATLAQYAIQWREGREGVDGEIDVEGVTSLGEDILRIATRDDKRSMAYGADITFHITRVPVSE